MNQPPQNRTANHPPNQTPPQWRRPRGVAQGTWQYVNQRSIADHYDDFVADTPLCELDQEIIQATFPTLADVPPDMSQQTVIDLGCGTGRTAIPLAERGYDVIGVDLSEAMLQQLVAKTNHLAEPTGNHVGKVQPIRANLVQLDCLANDSADHAVCLFSTLGMIAGHANRVTMMRHVARIVRPGGRLVLHVHHRWAALFEPDGLKKLARSWWNSVTRSDADFGDSVYQYRGLEDMFMHRFSRRELRGLLKSTRWQIDQLHPVSLDGASTTKSVRRAGGFIVVATNLSQPTL